MKPSLTIMSQANSGKWGDERDREHDYALEEAKIGGFALTLHEAGVTTFLVLALILR